MIEHIAVLLAKLSLIQILGFVALLLLMASLVAAHFNKNTNFDLWSLVLDDTTGKVSSYKFAFITVLVTMTYGFIVLLNEGKMTEGYAGLYAGTFIAGRIWGKDRNPNTQGKEPGSK